MYINLTFIIQTANFFITYWFLGKYLFTPFIAILKEKEDREARLHAHIEGDEKLLIVLKQTKDDQLVSFQQKVMAQYPELPNNYNTFVMRELGKCKDFNTNELVLVVKETIVKACDGI